MDVVDERQAAPQVAQRPRPRSSEPTRYLVAAAFRDRAFRERVLKLDAERFRALAPEYGIDMAAIARACRTSRRIALYRSLALLLPLLVLVATPGFVSDLAYVASYPQDLPFLLDYYAGSLVLAWVLAAIIVFGERWYLHHLLVARLSRKAFHQTPRGDAEPAQPAANAIIYGGYSPFVGSGVTVGGWSFCVRVDKGAESFGKPAEPRAFTLTALYERIAQDIGKLELPQLEVADRLCVDGREIRDDRRFLPVLFERPRQSLDEAEIKEVQESPGEAVRHYRIVTITGWHGELMLTLFLRFQLTPRLLFAEANYTLLTPVQAKYRQIDSEDPTINLTKLYGMAVWSAVLAPVLAIWAPLRIVSSLIAPLQLYSARRAQRRMIKRNPAFNFGAETSIREFAASHEYRVYFQHLDKEMNVKFLEKRVLDSMVEFLEEHGIDTSGLKERETTILNNGLIVTGGEIKAEGLAVGERARALGRRLAGESPRPQRKAA